MVVADRERVERAYEGCQRRGIRLLGVRLGDGEVPEGVERWEEVLPLGAAMPEQAPGPDDDVMILYTSGTTGRPKGAVSTHRAVTQSLMGFGCRIAIERARQAPSDGSAEEAAPAGEPPTPVLILVVPLFHVTGLVPVMLSCFASGVKLVMMYRWDAERALEIIERERVTSFVGVPTQSWDMLESPRFKDFDTSSLTSVGGGGAPMPPQMVARVEQSFAKGRPSIGYGMTETNAYGPGHSGDDFVRHPTSTGRGTPIMQVEVRDEVGNALPTGGVGEIWFSGPHLIRGYWNKPEATAETIVDGWLRTGDLGRVDDEGFVYVQDRAEGHHPAGRRERVLRRGRGRAVRAPVRARGRGLRAPPRPAGRGGGGRGRAPARHGADRHDAGGVPQGAPGRLQGAEPVDVGRRTPAPERGRQGPQAQPARRARRLTRRA